MKLRIGSTETRFLVMSVNSGKIELSTSRIGLHYFVIKIKSLTILQCSKLTKRLYIKDSKSCYLLNKNLRKIYNVFKRLKRKRVSNAALKRIWKNLP
jgi:hypothetical protein